MSDRERDDLLDALRKHRGFLRHTVEGLTDDQARLRPTVSELCLGGLLKHVAQVERRWAEFVVEGSAVMEMNEVRFAEHAAGFQMGPDETLADLLAEYDRVAAITDALVLSVASLDDEQTIPPAPWAPVEVQQTARRTFIHVVAETAQHAGHADILREAIDGQKSMG